jgi:hypothetical protein
MVVPGDCCQDRKPGLPDGEWRGVRRDRLIRRHLANIRRKDHIWCYGCRPSDQRPLADVLTELERSQGRLDIAQDGHTVAALVSAEYLESWRRPSRRSYWKYGSIFACAGFTAELWVAG